MTVIVTVGVASGIGAAFSLVAWRRFRSELAADTMRLREETARCEADCAARITEFRLQFDALAVSMRNTEELLREGRLNRSSRAQAMHLLRTGVSPDTAAARLGMAKREMNLLSKVSLALSR